MQSTSSAWKSMILNPDVGRICKARATISMGISLIESSATITSDASQFPENLQQLVNGITSPSYAYLALDSVWLVGDGLALSGAGSEVGFVSNAVSGQNGAFAAPPSITAAYKTAQIISEIPLAFDDKRHERATAFRIEFYDKNGNFLGHWEFTGNTEESLTCSLATASSATAGEVVSGVYAMTLRIGAWSVPGACARVTEWGGAMQEQVTGDDRLITLTVNEQIDQASVELGGINASKLTMEIDNTDNRYTYDAEDSIFYHIRMENKTVWVEFGLQIDPDDDESIEWIDGGVFYIHAVSAADGLPTATITAYDLLNVCDNYEYATRLAAGAHTLQEHGEDMLASLPFAPEARFAAPFGAQYASSAASPTLPTWPSGTTVRGALKSLMEASAGRMRQARDGALEFLTCMSADPETTNAFTGEILTYSAASPYEITTDASFLPIRDETAKETWRNQVRIYYGANAGRYRSWFYADSITESGLNDENIRGNVFNQSGLCLGSPVPAFLDCACRSLASLYRPTQVVRSFAYRCDPAIEPGDAVRVYDRLGNYVTGWVMAHTITFAGGFTGEIVLRGIPTAAPHGPVPTDTTAVVGRAIVGKAIVGKSS